MSRRLFALVTAVSSSCLLAQAALAGINVVGAELVNVSPKVDYIASGDLNNDGRADVVTVSPNSKEVTVYVAASTPTFFAPARVYRFGQTLRGVTVGDINADGRLDAVVADQGASSVWILIGRGDGTFQTPYQVQIQTSRNPVAVAIGNVDDVGNRDLVVADQRLGRLFILLNDNETPPGFRRGGEIDIGLEPVDVRLVDLNRDGKLDILSLNVGGPRVKDIAISLWKRVAQGFPEFDTPQRFTIGEKPSSMVVDDFNNDGVPDLATLNRPAGGTGNSELNIMLSQGNGVLFPPIRLPVPCPFFTGGAPCKSLALAAADFDGNGVVDLMVALADPRRSRGSASSLADAMQAFAGRGDGVFVPGPVFATQKAPAAMTTGDVSGDRKPDVVVANDRTLNLQAFVNVSTAGGAGNGEECFLGDECLSNRCLNGVCCASACDPIANEVCNVPGREGTCVPRPPGITECDFEDECPSGQPFCVENICCDQACVGGRCDVEDFEGVCVPGLPTGEICEIDRQCASGFCSQNFVCCSEPCQQGWCDDLGVCHARLNNGDLCEENVECLSNVCDMFDSICCNRRCDPNSEHCFLDDGPFKGRCVPFDFTPPPTATQTPTRTADPNLTPKVIGEPCTTPAQCQNNQCVNGVCCLEASCPSNMHCGLGTGVCEAGAPGTPTATPNACNNQCSTSRCINGACVVTSSSGGCAVGDPDASGDLAALALLPLALLAGRRWQLARARGRAVRQ